MPSLAAIDAELCRRSLRELIRQAWHVLEPASPYVESWHIAAICDHLEAVTRGEIRNLLINIPPRHMKSLAVSVFWPVWEWLTAPARRWLFSSYSLSLSIRDSRKCRQLIESPWFQNRWGNGFSLNGDEYFSSDKQGNPVRVIPSEVFALAEDQNAKMRFENNRTGYRIATSVGGLATGEGGDRIVVDDPHNVRERDSDAVRGEALIWWDETMSTRGNDPKTFAKVIVMQRVHEKDLSGHVLAQGGYVHLCLPAEFEPSRKCVTQIGFEDPRKTEGELLCPQRVGPTEIAELKLRLGPTAAAGQLQQSPTPSGGGRFKSSWFRYWRKFGEFYRLYKPDGTFKAVKIDECDRFAMMDPAGLEKDQGDKPCYTVIQIWDITPDNDMVLVDQVRDQMEIPTSAERAVGLCRTSDIPWIGVEDAGLGLGAMQTIRKRGVAVRPIKARGSKESRSETAEIRTAAGTVYFPHGAEWLFVLEAELTRFPNSEFKDQVDAFAHAAIWVQKHRGVPTQNEDEQYREAVESATESAENESEAKSRGQRLEMALSAARSGEDDSMFVSFDQED